MDTNEHQIKFYRSGKPFCTCGNHGEMVFLEDDKWMCETVWSEQRAKENPPRPNYLQTAYELATQNPNLDQKRLAKALALAQSATKDSFGLGYFVKCSAETDPSERVLITARPGYIGPCNCPDRKRNGELVRVWCKHRLAVTLLEKASELERKAQADALNQALRNTEAIYLEQRAADKLALYGE